MTFPLGHVASPEAEAARIERRPLVGGLIGVTMTGIDGVQDMREWTGPVTTQIGNSCCWDSSCGAVESKARFDGSPIPKLSVKFSWICAQLRDQQRRGVPYEQRRAWDQGSRLDMGFLAWREHGLVTEERCPFDPEDLLPKADGRADMRVPLDVHMAAADVLFTADYGVAAVLAPTVLRMAMREGHFPIIAIDVDRVFLELVGRDAEYDGVRNAGDIVGGHAMRVVGARPRVGSSASALLLQNSWGTGWGDGGFVWLTDRAVSRGRDAAVITAAPRLATAA